MERIIKAKHDCTLMNPQEIITTILDGRGITDDYADFLNPPLDIKEEWFDIEGMKEGAQKVYELMQDPSNKYFVNIDSDTDGVTSGAILIRWLKHHGINPEWYVNPGKSHGTTAEMMEKVQETKSNVVFILDSLDGTVDNYLELESMGCEVFILDHHDLTDDIVLYEPAHLISSNRCYNKELSGAGVTWLFVNCLETLLPEEDNDEYSLELLDLAATGMIADMMDMKVIQNRAISFSGLNHIANPAIKKVKGSFPFNAKSVSFSVAPLINAACRLNKNEVAVKFLLADANAQVLMYYNMLKTFKKEQDEEVAALMESCEEQVSKQTTNGFFMFEIESDNGVAGLVANKLTARYDRPVIVINKKQTGSGNRDLCGSARSVGNVNFRQLCAETGLCMAAGHPEAFGFAIESDELETFKKAIDAKLESKENVIEIKADAEVDVDDLTLELARMVEQVDFVTGLGFPALKFAVTITGYELDTMSGGKHLMFRIPGRDNLQIVKWNTGDCLEYYEKIKHLPLTLFGSLDTTFMARKPAIRMVLDEIIS